MVVITKQYEGVEKLKSLGLRSTNKKLNSRNCYVQIKCAVCLQPFSSTASYTFNL